MKRSTLLHIVYWILMLIFLTIIFGFSWENNLLAFSFSLLLLPVVIMTTYVFNLFLVPKYLMTRRYKKFALYFFYMLVGSLYIEMLIALFSFVIIAKSNTETVNLDGISIFTLGITLYLIVFLTSFIKLFLQFQKREQIVERLKQETAKNKLQSIQVRAERKNHLVPLDELFYIESLNDYVKIVMENSQLITKEKITTLSEKLPDNFVRIHRSFLVNAEKVNAFTTTQINILETSLPISRTYKKRALETLERLQKNS
jgi:hypothetical protein